jgi:dUTPase
MNLEKEILDHKNERIFNYIKDSTETRSPTLFISGLIVAIRANAVGSWNLYATKEQTVFPGSWADVRLDLAVELPSKHFGYIGAPIRSGKENKTADGIDVLDDVLDEAYTGSLYVRVINHDCDTHTINPGDLIARLEVRPIVSNIKMAHVHCLPGLSKK